MSLPIFASLLVAALLHAVWNGLVRYDSDRRAASTAIAAGGAAIGLMLVLSLPLMRAAAIPYVAVSSLFQVAYYALVARAYRDGELSVSYPVMRGLAPLMVTVAAALFIETPAPVVVIGIVVVAVGIVALGIEGLKRGASGLVAAGANACVIAIYTLCDGLGARVSGAPVDYVAWGLVGGGGATVVVAAAVKGRSLVTDLVARIPLGLVGGAMSCAAYGIALWAMTIAPIGAVAAVRESSVLFATAIGAVALGERFGPVRWAAAALVVVGLALVEIGGAT